LFESLSNLFRSFSLLRHPEVRKSLGEMRFRQILLAEIKKKYPGAKLDDGIEWVAYEQNRLILGERVSICHGCILAFGDEQNGFGEIHIGSDTWIGQYNNLRASGFGGDIKIGSHCLISQFCSLIGSNHMIGRDKLIMNQGPDKKRVGVVLNDDVWLGVGVSIMPGVSIEVGAVIGANSVVTESVPACEIWAGCPARKIGERS